MAIFSKVVGPVEIWFDGSKLGDSYKTTNLRYNETYHSPTLAKTGQTKRGMYVIGEECTATGEIGEASLTQIASLMGASVTAGSTTDEVEITTRVGKDLMDNAGIVILKPIIARVVSAVAADWIYIPKGVIKVEFDVPIGIDDDRRFAYTIEGLPLTDDDIASGGGWDGEGYAAGTIIRYGVAD